MRVSTSALWKRVTTQCCWSMVSTVAVAEWMRTSTGSFRWSRATRRISGGMVAENRAT